MKSVNRAKLDLIIAVTAFGTIGIFVRYINLPSSVIAFVRGAVGAVFLLLLLYLRRTPFRWASVQPHWKLLALSGAIISFNWITLFEAYRGHRYPVLLHGAGVRDAGLPLSLP